MSYDLIPNTRIFLIRHHSYFFFCRLFCAATNRMRILFEGSVYFFKKACLHVSYVQVIEQDLIRIRAICAAGQTLCAANHNATTDKCCLRIVATASIKGPWTCAVDSHRASVRAVCESNLHVHNAAPLSPTLLWDCEWCMVQFYMQKLSAHIFDNKLW